jgi:hypothetical protein
VRFGFPWRLLHEVECLMRKSLKTFSLVFFAFLLLASSYFVCKTQAVSTSTSSSILGVQVQVVDSLGATSLVLVDSSFALDSADNPHVAYSDGKTVGIKYASWNGSGWDIQVVDTVGDDMSIHLALDSKANPYITYRYLDSSGYPYLKYAHWDGSTWKTQILDSGGDYNSIAVDSKDNPHIAYYGRMSLHYASWDGAKWNFETVESGGTQEPDSSYTATGTWVSLKLDSNDNPHISYYDPTNYWKSGEVKYASWNGASWVIQDVAPVLYGDYYIHTSLALDSKGNPHIAYRGDTGLMYAASDGSSWNVQTVDYSLKQADSVGEAASLVMDSNDIPHIIYEDSYRFSVLKYAFLNGSTWQINPLTPTFHGGYSISTALDSKGKIHICRDDMSTLTLNHIIVDEADLPPPTQLSDPSLKLSTPSPFSEAVSPLGTAESIDRPGCSGCFTSLVLDAQGNPHISYYDRFFNDLRYAYSDGSNWYAQTVDTDGWVGIYSSLALDAKVYPHISYLDDFNNKLKYAQWNGSAWAVQTLDSIGGIHSYTSLALDAKGYAHISYFDGANHNLKYASWNGSAWSFQIVDMSGFAGEYSSLKLDSNGYPHISYYDTSNGCLKYASWTGTNWTIQIVDSKGNVGISTSLTLDSQNNPRISYVDITNNLIKYAYLSDSTWNTQTIATTKYGDYVKFFNTSLDYTSIALDSKDNTFISYVDGEARNLKLAFSNGTTWTIQTVDSTFDSGWTSSLALDSNNGVHISYYVGKNIGDLMYATSADKLTYFAKPAPIWTAPIITTATPPPPSGYNSTTKNTEQASNITQTNGNTNQDNGNQTINGSPKSLQNLNIDGANAPENTCTPATSTPSADKQEQFPTVIIAVALASAGFVLCPTMLVHFKGRQHR